MKLSRSLPTVCIVGRTNVGKSTLFNALVGSRKAVVKDTPGVTRDRCYQVVTRFAFPFTLIDTGALVGEENISLHQAVKEQSELAIRQSDVILVVFDGLHGLHPQDQEVVELVKRSNKPTIWIANKCEKPSAQLQSNELYALGIGDILPISAAHRRGIRELVNRIDSLIPTSEDTTLNEDMVIGENIEVPEEHEANLTISLAILGKPNVGKSTLVNKLLGEERMITSPIAGTTRDSIRSEISREGRKFVIVDTAGLRKKAGVKDGSIERFSNIRTLRTLAESNVAVFLLDASEGIPTEQDARIVGLAHEKGKPLVIVINKWDIIEKDSKTAEAYRIAVRSVFKFAQYAPIVFVSALTGQRCLTVLDHVVAVYEASQIRVSTSEANRIFGQAFATKPPPVYRGMPVKLLYATQVAVKPPTFALFVNYPERILFSYERYLKNYLRKHNAYEGSDIKLLFRRRSQVTNERKKAV